jgi:hypothetical protein
MTIEPTPKRLLAPPFPGTEGISAIKPNRDMLGQTTKSSSGGVLLTENELAERWRLKSPKKLQADRAKGVGCPYVRIGRCVRYRVADVEAYEAANLQIPHFGKFSPR